MAAMARDSHQTDSPSAWVGRWARLIRPGGRVLDLACGYGRHLRYLSSLGFSVVGVDRDEAAIAALRQMDGVELRAADLEQGPWPFGPEAFDGIVVTNYLHRPLFAPMLGSLRDGGALIYETFAAGNEMYGRPSNPAFLLQPNELLQRVEPLAVVAFEQGRVSVPRAAVIQRVCAVRGGDAARLLEPPRAEIGLE
jgi:SAM-dependent methyltransferase